MLTDPQIQEIRSRFKIFKHNVYNTLDDVQAVMEVLKTNIDLMVVHPASVGSYD